MEVTESEKSWLPLECNPDIFNLLAARLGFPIGTYSFVDVFGLDAEIWSTMMPQPIVSVILAFPIKEMHKGMREFIRANVDHETESSVCFIKQKIRNACGTVGLLHALMNLSDFIDSNEFVQDSFLDKFQKWISVGTEKTSDDKAQYLIDSEELEQLHMESASEGNSECTDCTAVHYMTFVEVNNKVFELDGRQTKPGCLGTLEGENLGIKVTAHIQKYMELDPHENQFTMIALVKTG